MKVNKGEFVTHMFCILYQNCIKCNNADQRLRILVEVESKLQL